MTVHDSYRHGDLPTGWRLKTEPFKSVDENWNAWAQKSNLTLHKTGEPPENAYNNLLRRLKELEKQIEALIKGP